jgi:hypothetical protein
MLLNCKQNVFKMLLNCKNTHILDSAIYVVVNCFQNCILAYNSQQKQQLSETMQVVNCFQNCILAYNSQPQKKYTYPCISCELLSELYFSL